MQISILCGLVFLIALTRKKFFFAEAADSSVLLGYCHCRKSVEASRGVALNCRSDPLFPSTSVGYFHGDVVGERSSECVVGTFEALLVLF